MANISRGRGKTIHLRRSKHYDHTVENARRMGIFKQFNGRSDFDMALKGFTSFIKYKYGTTAFCHGA